MINNKLEKNIRNIVIEQQIKLGYVKEPVWLYFPASSIKNILESKNVSLDELDNILNESLSNMSNELGRLSYSRSGERYCIKVPAIASEFIYDNRGDAAFLTKVIDATSKHDCTIENIVDIFKEFSDSIVFEKMENEDFDYLIYFKNEEIDEYRYCFKKEGEHMIYHRFLKEDYTEL